MSWRRFGVILAHLPQESWFHTEVRNESDPSERVEPEPGVYGPWSQADHLAARTGDLLNHWLWMNADPDKRPAVPPAPHPRPGVEVDNVRPINDEAMAFLQYVRDHHGEHPPDGWKPALA